MRDGEQKSKTTFAADNRALTAVTDFISEAQTWLADKLTVLKSPLPHLMYSKLDFGGTLFAKFRDQHQRDLAVTLLKSAAIFYERKPVWAAPDTNPVERAARNFCFGLKRVFKVGSNIPHAVQVNESSPYTVTVGGELALTAHISSGGLVREWHGEWAHRQSQVHFFLFFFLGLFRLLEVFLCNRKRCARRCNLGGGEAHVSPFRFRHCKLICCQHNIGLATWNIECVTASQRIELQWHMRCQNIGSLGLQEGNTSQ